MFFTQIIGPINRNEYSNLRNPVLAESPPEGAVLEQN
jgi:hypothetical protein